MQHDIMLEIRVEAIKKILYTKLKSYDLILLGNKTLSELF